MNDIYYNATEEVSELIQGEMQILNFPEDIGKLSDFFPDIHFYLIKKGEKEKCFKEGKELQQFPPSRSPSINKISTNGFWL